MLPPAVVNIDIDINVFLNITVFWKNFKVLSLTCLAVPFSDKHHV